MTSPRATKTMPPPRKRATPTPPPKDTPPKEKLTPIEKSLLEGVVLDDKPMTEEDIPQEYRKGILVKPLSKLYQSFALFILPFDERCGKALMINAEKMAQSLDELAATNKSVREFLMRLVKTSAWGAVVAAHLPLFMTIALHHVPAFQKQMENISVNMPEGMY